MLAAAIAGGGMLILPRQRFQLGGAIFPSFRLSPESSVVIFYYGNGAGKHRFRHSPE